MKKLYLFILSICLLFTGCAESSTTAFVTKPVYEITSIEGADLIEDGTGALIGLFTGGFGGLIIGAVAEDTINKMDIKNNSIKLTLHCVEPKNLRSSYSTMTMTVKQGDLITAGWKLNDKLKYVDDCKFYKCKDVDGLEYTKSATIGVFAIPQIGYFKKVEE